MNLLLSFIKRHPLVTFASLAYLLSWWSAPFANGQIMPQGPAAAAVIVLALTSGRSGLRSLWQRITHWRVAWYWYVIGPGIIASYLAGAYLFNLLLGASAVRPPLLPTLGIILELVFFGGWLEEPGWSGYALPKLQKHFGNRTNGALLAALGVGVMRAVWHLPLYIYGHIPWFDVVVSGIATQLIITWLFNRSSGSVLVVMWFHLASNIFFAAIYSHVFTGAEWTRYYALFVALKSLIALGILWRSGAKLGKDDAQMKLALVDQAAA